MTNEIKFSKVRDVKSPIRGHDTDAGIDFFVPNHIETIILEHGEQAIIPTGIKMNIPAGTALVAFNKSGVVTKKQLLKGAEVCDAGYEGEIHINVHNIGKNQQIIEPGDKLIQFILLPILSHKPVEVDGTDLYSASSSRGSGNFGSTGNK